MKDEMQGMETEREREMSSFTAQSNILDSADKKNKRIKLKKGEKREYLFH